MRGGTVRGKDLFYSYATVLHRIVPLVDYIASPLSYLGWLPPPNLSAAVNSHLRWVQGTTQDVTYRE